MIGVECEVWGVFLSLLLILHTQHSKLLTLFGAVLVSTGVVRPE